MRKNTVLMIMILGIVGAFVLGLGIGLRQISFSTSEKLYINGVAMGAKFQEQFPDNENPKFNAHELCIKEYYPDHPNELAGCFEVLEEKDWKLP